MTTTTLVNDSQFYCSQKFWWLSVDISKRQTFSCCAATPDKIDTSWLKKNTGQLFNTPHLRNERSMMLSNRAVTSCEKACWEPEQQQLVSRRLLMNSKVITDTNIQSTPRVLHIVVGNDCNMSCVYCCKQYSSSWIQDLVKNGPYAGVEGVGDRYEINNTDRILLKIGQKQMAGTADTKLLLDEISVMIQASELTKVLITGGEPFLHLGLAELVNSIPKSVKVIINSGLGVNTSRFANELDKLPLNQVEIGISAENTKDLYEFSRYGNTWKQFNDNILILKNKGIPYQFSAVISNLTIHGLSDFIEYATDVPIMYLLCNDPSFLSINVLDPASKRKILETVDKLPTDLSQLITNSINDANTDQQRQDLKNYITEFTKRRDISLNVFPKSFIEWITK